MDGHDSDGHDPHPADVGIAGGQEEPLIAVVAEPGQLDVLLGRGKGNQQHAGNKRLQDIVDLHKNSYFDASSRHGKVHIARLVVATVNEQGRFLRFDNRLQGWVEVSELVARQKVCQALQYHKRRDSGQHGAAGAGAASAAVTGVAAVDSVRSRQVATASDQAPVAADAGTVDSGGLSLVARLPDQQEDTEADDILQPVLSESTAVLEVAAAAVASALASTMASAASVGAVAAAAEPIHLTDTSRHESKLDEHVETDSDFMTVIRALSQGAHLQNDRNNEPEGSAPT